MDDRTFSQGPDRAVGKGVSQEVPPEVKALLDAGRRFNAACAAACDAGYVAHVRLGVAVDPVHGGAVPTVRLRVADPRFESMV